MPTIHDVAKRAGVSISTVSRAFASPGLISDNTEQRVRQAAGELNYRPRTDERLRLGKSPKGGGLARSTSRLRDTIGFQFFAASPYDTLACNTFYAPMLSGAQMEAAAAGVNLMVHTTDRHTLLADSSLMVDEASVQGVLLVGATDPLVIAAFAKRVAHMILVDNPDPINAHDCILSDGFEGGYMAARHLIELGHRHIAFFAPEEGVTTFRDRQRGYIVALVEAGIAIDPRLIFVYPGGTDGQKETFLVERLAALRGADRATAIVAANDFYAFFAIHTCERLGMAVPEQISIVGFDDAPQGVMFARPLTTVRVDKESMGRLAVRRLIARIEESRDERVPVPPCRYVIPVSLIVRESTCPPPL